MEEYISIAYNEIRVEFNTRQPDARFVSERNEIMRMSEHLLPCISPEDQYELRLEFEEIALLLYLYFGKPLNKTHAELIRMMTNGFQFKHIEYLVNYKIPTFYRKKQGFASEKVLKNIDICLDTLDTISKHLKDNKNKLQQLFKGRFRITHQQHRRKRRGSLSDEWGRRRRPTAPLRGALNVLGFYRPYDEYVDGLQETWSMMIPDKVCDASRNLKPNDVPALFITLNVCTVPLELVSEHKQEFIRLRKEYKLKKDQHLVLSSKFMIELKQCQKQILISRFIIYIENHHSNHANSLIFDKINKRIYRIEPLGGSFIPEIDTIIENELLNKLKDYEYVGIIEICPYGYGLQQLEERLPDALKLPRDVGSSGYCFIWSLMFLEYIIHYPEWTPNEIYDYLIGQGRLSEKVYAYLTRLLNTFYQLLISGHPFRTDQSKALEYFNQVNERFDTIVHRYFDYNPGQLDDLMYFFIYHGFITFERLFELIMNHVCPPRGVRLPEGEHRRRLINLDTFLQRMSNNDLYESLRRINATSPPTHKQMIDPHLPNELRYYENTVKNAFNACTNNEIIPILNSICQKYFS